MSDPNDTNLSPIGRKWDNTPAPPNPKWRLERAALYGLAASVVLFVIDTLVGELTGRQKPFAVDPVSFVVRVGLLPVIFVIVAAIRNLSKAKVPPENY